MAIDPDDRLRYRSMLISQAIKTCMCMLPERPRRGLIGWLLRQMFLGPDGRPHAAGEIVLAELRHETGLHKATNFHVDPTVHAYREGQRKTAMWFFTLLHLDEDEVQQLMRVDDGLGE